MKKFFGYFLAGMLGVVGFVGLTTSSAAAQGGGGQPVTFGGNQGAQYAGQIQGVGTNNTPLLTVLTNAINFVLGMLSLIALCILLYGGFNMVTAAGDNKKYEEGFTILRQAGVGFIFIALSWIAVQFIFFVIGSIL